MFKSSSLIQPYRVGFPIKDTGCKICTLIEKQITLAIWWRQIEVMGPKDKTLHEWHNMNTTFPPNCSILLFLYSSVQYQWSMPAKDGHYSRETINFDLQSLLCFMVALPWINSSKCDLKILKRDVYYPILNLMETDLNPDAFSVCLWKST